MTSNFASLKYFRTGLYHFLPDSGLISKMITESQILIPCFSAIFVKKSGMTQALITTETTDEMKKILELFRKNKLKFRVVSIKSNPADTNEKIDPIMDDEWILPGRPANASERKRHAERISRQRGGITTEELLKEIALWREVT